MMATADVPDGLAGLEDLQAFLDCVAGDPVQFFKLRIRSPDVDRADQLGPVAFKTRSDLHHNAVTQLDAAGRW